MNDSKAESTYQPTRPSRRKRKPIRSRILRSTAVLPAGCTLLNGLSGFAAIHFAAKGGLGVALDEPGALGNLKLSAALIFVAMIFDMLDGRLARMTRTTSDFGAQLDSLCDMISFGVAPAVLILRSAVSILRAQFDYLAVERIVWCLAGVYVLCAALRLARFNVETDVDESAHMDFHGLPSPAAAACLASMVLLFTHLSEKQLAWLPSEILLRGMSFILPFLALGAGLLMVTRFRYPHLINHYIRGRRPFGYLVRLVLIGLAMCLEPFVTLAAATSFYAFWGPIRSTWLAYRRRRKDKSSPVNS
ncbi:MAG: CDP-diacylglycerol--serine O-phosphatidyltransferase [Phycisphaerae bacterium]|nr:CDP-diacylglycerol--serine O-phosphatidyltransferase [Phycisphaerae bacterium]